MIQLKPMPEADFKAYLEVLIPDYAQENVKSGRWTAEEALAASRAEIDKLLPDGLATENQYIFNIVADEETQPVGILWFAVDKGKAFVYDIVTYDAFRRRGYATQALLIMEDKARQMGLNTISLHVFGNNHAARVLYQKLGFVETNVMMSKTLD
jgi:ribosomal protein S18 acetylase RimI-like enzyme